MRAEAILTHREDNYLLILRTQRQNIFSYPLAATV